ncbi:MAG: hypothetical protein HXS54_05975 [Theionarchaea archaeon]|nr:hypothetical protein [Theionarchaea archaeon]DBA34807.1 TPA_asm: hypothetical protein vir521_00013 [Caudoviricetes sp. vir521]
MKIYEVVLDKKDMKEVDNVELNYCDVVNFFIIFGPEKEELIQNLIERLIKVQEGMRKQQLKEKMEFFKKK